MIRIMVCLLGSITLWQFGHLAEAQEPTQILTGFSTLSCDTLTNATSKCHPQSVACKRTCFPTSCCCDDYNPHPFPRLCVPAYSSWFRCVPAGDVSCCPTAGAHQARRTWWFVPTRQALKEALWLDP